jgi:hypothetical protein
MSRKHRALALAAAAPLALAPLAVAGTAYAANGGSQTYQANLTPVPLNGNQGAHGTFMMTVNGDQGKITEQVSGLSDKIPTDKKTLKAVNIPASLAGAAFPHAQHIHGEMGGQGKGQCPTASADSNGDGLINSHTEAIKSYGPVLTSMTTKGDTSPKSALKVTRMPGGASYSYNRTVTLSSETLKNLKNGTAAIAVHGLNPANAPKASLDPSKDAFGLKLPGESSPVAPVATAPALCGVVHATSASATSGGVQTGAGGTSGVEDAGLLALGGGFLAAAAGALGFRRRRSSKVTS